MQSNRVWLYTSYYIFVISLPLFLLVACKNSEPAGELRYIDEMEQWRAQRLGELKGPESWLNLAGLYELQAGENSFGAGLSNDLIYPPGKAPDKLGSFILIDEQLKIKIEPDAKVFLAGKEIREMAISPEGDAEPAVFEYGSLRWYVIKRGKTLYVRLRDLESDVLKQFEGIESYVIDSGWRVEAKLVKHDSIKLIPVPNILGYVSDWESPGMLQFEIADKKYQLDALGKLIDEKLFVIFTDETNGVESYPAGRFMYVKTPGEDGKTRIDFNKAYNPPCAFTAYATCPLPPEQNRLTLRVTAGEKNYEGGVH